MAGWRQAPAPCTDSLRAGLAWTIASPMPPIVNTTARRLGRAVAFASFAWVAACGHDKEAGDEEQPREPPRLVGRVASLPAEGGFVLIQSYGAWTVPEGEAVFSRGADGRTANLLPTGEHLSQFVAADIRGGQVAVGDAVYALAKAKPAANGAGENAADGATATPKTGATVTGDVKKFP